MKLDKLNSIIAKNYYEDASEIVNFETESFKDAAELMSELLVYFSDEKHSEKFCNLLVEFVDEYARENF